MDKNVHVLLLNGAQGSTIPSHMNVESRVATSDHNTKGWAAQEARMHPNRIDPISKFGWMFICGKVPQARAAMDIHFACSYDELL